MGKKVKKDSEPPPKDVFDPLSVESKNAKTAVLMLDSPEDDVLAKACEAIYKYAEKCDENRAALLAMGAVEPLLRLLKHEERPVHRNAMMAFGCLTQYPDVRKVLRKMECIPSVVQLLNPEEDTITHEFGSLFLSCMANEYTSKIQIMEHDGLEPLIRLLTATDPDVQKNSIEAISLLLQDFTCRSAIRALEGLQPILDLIKSEYPVIQQLALDSLTKITQDTDKREALRELEALDSLLKFLNHKEWTDLHISALSVLSNMLEDPDSLENLQQSGGLQKLLKFITAETTLPEVQHYAAMAMSRAGRNRENRQILHDQQLETTLIQLLSTDSETQVRAAAARALATMSDNLMSKDFVGRNEGIHPLIALVKHDNADMKEAGTLTIANLTTANSYNCSEVFEKHGIEPLINAITDGKEAAQANAAACLTNLSPDEVIRNEIIRLGAIPALATALQSKNVTVQSKSALALSALICNSEARAEMRNSGCVEPLVKLLTSGNEDVRRNAAWAITVSASDEPTANEISKSGALAILQEIQQSTTRRSPFTDVALERLLDNSLSAKYSLMGHLSASNSILNGFYDAGQMKPGSPFQALEELCRQPVNERRPVLLINATNIELTSATPSPSDQDVKADTSKTSLTSRSKTNAKGSAVKRGRSREKDDSKTKIDEERATAESPDEETAPFSPPQDQMLDNYIKYITHNILTLTDNTEQVAALAKYVADRMGGQIERGQLSNFSYELQLSKLKFELQSNVIPIGRIKAGIFYHRALLFKALADKIGVGCTLTRGEYNRAWNEVLLQDPAEDQDGPPGAPKLPPKSYIVDLVYEPGRLIAADAPDAVAYQRL